MTRFLIALLSAALALAGSQSPAGRPTPGPLLRIDAVALDSRGNPVTDLTKDELEVRIANYRVPIESLTASDASAEGSGRVIVLLMDDAVVPLALTPRVREIARRFVDRGPDLSQPLLGTGARHDTRSPVGPRVNRVVGIRRTHTGDPALPLERYRRLVGWVGNPGRPPPWPCPGPCP